MLRMLVTDDDLLRTRVAQAPDPLHEIVVSLRPPRASAPTSRLTRWRADTSCRLMLL
jgi:hypothetical protein